MADGRRSERPLELADPERVQRPAIAYPRPRDAAPSEDSIVARFLSELPAIAWRRRRRLALGAFGGAVLALAYLAVTPPVYVIRALVHIEQRESVLQQYDALRAGATFIGTQAEVIQGPSVVGGALDSIGLPEPKAPGLVKRAKLWLRSLDPFGEPTPRDPRAAAILQAQASLGASPVVGTDLMSISYRVPNPVRGVAFLNALIDTYRDDVRGIETDAHREGLALLKQEDEELRRQLEVLERRYDEVHSTALLLGEGDDSLSVQKLRLEEQARAHVEAQGRRIELENRLAQYKQSGTSPLSERNQVMEDLNEAEALLAELKASRNERHPDVRATQQRIELLREQLAKNSATQRAAIESELRAARRTEQMLSHLYQEEWEATKEFEQQRRQEEEILGQIKDLTLKRDALGALLRDKEIRVLSLHSGHSGTVVRVVEPPTVPTEKAWPQPSIVLVAFGFLGTLAGLGSGVLCEYREQREVAAGA